MSNDAHVALVPPPEDEVGGSWIVPSAGSMPTKSGVVRPGIVKLLPSLQVSVPAPSVSVALPCASMVPVQGSFIVQVIESVMLVPGPVVVHVLLLWKVIA